VVLRGWGGNITGYWFFTSILNISLYHGCTGYRYGTDLAGYPANLKAE
jgi:hypothetical protein